MANLCILFCIVFVTSTPWAQTGGQKILDKGEMEEFADSLKTSEYPYVLPIMGQQVTNRGVDLPLPFGVMANYVRSKQDILIDQIAIGFNDGDLEEISDFVRFRDIDVLVNTYNIRADVWLLPFFNVSGVFGYVDTETTVRVGLPIDLTAVSVGRGPYYGLGMLLAGGVGPIWGSVDYNAVWAKTDQLDKANLAQIVGIRAGHVINFHNKTQQNVSFWVGAQFQDISSETVGSVRLDDVIDIPEGRKDQVIEDLTTWLNGLGLRGQEIMEPIVEDFIDAINNTGGSDTVIRYSLTKSLANPWSMAIGAQWQINKRWQVRSEYNFLGSREQLLISLNYRFGIKGKTTLSGKD